MDGGDIYSEFEVRERKNVCEGGQVRDFSFGKVERFWCVVGEGSSVEGGTMTNNRRKIEAQRRRYSSVGWSRWQGSDSGPKSGLLVAELAEGGKGICRVDFRIRG